MKRFLLFFILTIASHFIHAGVLSVEGTYQGKNLYIQNPLDDEGFGYCVTKVTVNGDILIGETNNRTFEVDFADFNIGLGEPVFIVIESNEGCTPKILNPEVLLPKSTYQVESINVSKNGLLEWTTNNEQGKLPFIIEQYRWNKWIRIGEIQGKGREKIKNSYVFQINPHSGENTIRVVQIDHSGKKRTSKSVKFISKQPRLTKTPTKVKSEIQFISSEGVLHETLYEIFDAYGNIVKRGAGKKVNCSNLKRGIYYINFDNNKEKFIKN